MSRGMDNQPARPWILRGAALLLLLALGIWISNNTHWEEVTIPMPLKGEAVTDEQYAQRIFLESLGVKVESRRTFADSPPRRAVVIVDSWHWDLIEARKKKMEAWIKAGGRLIVDTTLIDSLDDFAKFSGIKQDFPKVDKDDDSEESDEDDDPKEGESTSSVRGLISDEKRCFEWTVDVDRESVSAARKKYSFCGIFIYGWLVSDTKPVWALRDSKGLQAVRAKVGEGFVTVLNGRLFDNRNFRDTERGALLVAAAQLRRDDVVWLLTESEHPSVLSLVWQYGSPVVVLFGLFVAAVIWRNSIRFGSLRSTPDAARRSLAEQIRGTGWFILRLGGARTLYKAMLRAVKEEGARRIVRFHALSPQQQVDALIARTGVDREELQKAYFMIAPDTRGSLRGNSRLQLYNAIALLETVRRILQHEKTAHYSSSTTDKTQEAPHAN